MHSPNKAAQIGLSKRPIQNRRSKSYQKNRQGPRVLGQSRPKSCEWWNLHQATFFTGFVTWSGLSGNYISFHLLFPLSLFNQQIIMLSIIRRGAKEILIPEFGVWVLLRVSLIQFYIFIIVERFGILLLKKGFGNSQSPNYFFMRLCL